MAVGIAEGRWAPVAVDGEVLRAWRRARGWDAQEMAARLRKAAGGRAPAHDSLVNMVYRWERTHLAGERYELLYARALGIDPDGLEAGPAPAPDDGESLPVSSGEEPARTHDMIRALLLTGLAAGPAPGAILDVDDVERRELLKIISGIALAAPLADGGHADRVRRGLDSALGAPTTQRDVDEWERATARYAVESGLVPPALLLPELLTDLDEAQSRLDGAPDAFRAPMARVCGHLSALAAMNFFNAGDVRNAGRYWRTALRAVGQADGRPAQAELYASRASFALLEEPSSPAAALALADDAIAICGDAPCAGATSAHGTRAMALALLGEHGASASALQDLAGAYARMPGTTSSARTEWGFSEQQLRFIEGHVHANC